MRDEAVAVRRDLRARITPGKARIFSRFFKTGTGEYGEGDVFWGVMMPQIRAVAKMHPALPPAGIAALLRSPVHEERVAALIILAGQFLRAEGAAREKLYRFYLAHTDRVNNWDLVDLSAPKIVGEHLVARPRGILRRLARSKNLWERRIAIVATFAFIRRGDLRDTFAIAEMLLGDRHDLIHKAAGWMLREAGKHDNAALEEFLRRNARAMPRTMLRYAIERFPERERKAYLAI